jgi:hypothetical protein
VELECDDSNQLDGDGCDRNCRREPEPTDGGVSPTDAGAEDRVAPDLEAGPEDRGTTARPDASGPLGSDAGIGRDASDEVDEATGGCGCGVLETQSRPGPRSALSIVTLMFLARATRRRLNGRTRRSLDAGKRT